MAVRTPHPPAPDRVEALRSDADTWPWQCLGCERTLYHDACYCATCAVAAASTRGLARRRSSPTFTRWLREQPYRSFLPTVTAISGVEVALTGLWLHLLL